MTSSSASSSAMLKAASRLPELRSSQEFMNNKATKKRSIGSGSSLLLRYFVVNPHPNLRAKFLDFAVCAVGLARVAAAAAVPDEPVAEQRPVRLRHQHHQFLLQFYRVRSLRQPKTIGKPRDMSVHDHADIDAEGVSEHDVGRLAPDAGERMQFIHRARDFAVEFFHQRGAAGSDVFRLVAEKTGGLDDLFNFREWRVRKILGTAVFFEKFRRDDVHALVRALRGQNRGDEQLQRIGKVQFAVGVWISPLERGDDFHRAILSGGGGFAWHRNDFVRRRENKKPGHERPGLLKSKVQGVVVAGRFVETTVGTALVSGAGGM